ncbi:hypothetical protein K469DRAFT_692217 [Zopfia rhizophila CBS 207.26]|uniref:Flavin reductase like domain-containing protein n=1 Tax=Zopfia rhizophila CBS 207.26 TaxID=1314779 RepID=A0A6A6DTS3_9PEZI|nr:hypothetical protein K469DRAFT_692217 [Zopfia rhizophila CBS 207.26]
MEHQLISPAILYWGTPVVLITTENDDGSSNIMPMSSAWWLGYRCMAGIVTGSHTFCNIMRTKQCVLNLPDASMAHFLNPIARTTGSEHMTPDKSDRGYKYCKDKWALSGMTPDDSMFVAPPRIKQCPVQMEAELIAVHTMMGDMDFPIKGAMSALELRILRVYVDPKIKMEGYDNRVDPDKWCPMIMSFQELYGLDNRKIVHSSLGEIEEEKYRLFTDTKIPKDTDTVSH